MVHSRGIGDKVLTFGISGRLYKSNVLFYDHQTESLWSQLMEKAVSGPLAGSRLHKFPFRMMDWGSWLKSHPRTLVLSTKTGHDRDYGRDPYQGYYNALGLMFPVGGVRRDLPPKEMVLGVELNGVAKAYPLSNLKKRPGTLKDRINGQEVLIEIDSKGQVVRVTDMEGHPTPRIFAYWFAWQAFHKKTLVFKD